VIAKGKERKGKKEVKQKGGKGEGTKKKRKKW